MGDTKMGCGSSTPESTSEASSAPAPAASDKVSVIGLPASANTMGCFLFAQHLLGDKHEFKQCNIMEGQRHTPEFSKINPFTQIPMLQDADGTSMGESTAILLHLNAKYGKQLDAQQTWALIMRTDKVYSGGWSKVVYPVLGFMPALEPEAAAKAVEELYKNLATYEATFLAGKTFVGGDEPCVADFAMAPLIFALKHENLKAATGFVLPEAWCKWMDAFTGKVPCAGMLSSCGGYSIGEMLDSKAPANAVDPIAAPTFEPAQHTACAASDKVSVIGLPASANTMGCFLFAQHLLGDKHEFKQCNIMEGQRHTPEFSKINPFTQIPMLQDADGTSMGESTAILLHLNAKYGKQLDAQQTWALIMRTDKVYSGGWSKVVYPVLGFMPALEPEAAAKAVEELYKNLATYEATFLAGKTFVGGDEPCVADFAMAPLIFALKHENLKAATGFVLPEAWCKWMDAFTGKVPCAGMLSSCGGYSIGEMLDSKGSSGN